MSAKMIKTMIKKGLSELIRQPEIRNVIADSLVYNKSDVMQRIRNIPVTTAVDTVSPSIRDRDDIVFVSARFRSGSTALWNAFRQLDEFTTYYEPFNERRFFDRDTRGSSVDSTHRGVDDYSREYDAVSGLDKLYNVDWTSKKLYMDENSWNPDMLKFIERLVRSADGNPLLQFNRIDFRLPWIRHHFPNSKIIHLWRDPREQWCSTLGDIARYPSSLPSESVPLNYYLRSWVIDLKSVMPFLSMPEGTHPYRYFYMLWKASYLFGMQYSNISVSLESLTSESTTAFEDIADTLEMTNREASIAAMRSAITPDKAKKAPTYANEDWFENHELACEKLLSDFFGEQRGVISDVGC